MGGWEKKINHMSSGNAPAIQFGRILHHGGQLGVRGVRVTGQFTFKLLQNGALVLLVLHISFCGGPVQFGSFALSDSFLQGEKIRHILGEKECFRSPRAFQRSKILLNERSFEMVSQGVECNLHLRDALLEVGSDHGEKFCSTARMVSICNCLSVRAPIPDKSVEISPSSMGRRLL